MREEECSITCDCTQENYQNIIAKDVKAYLSIAQWPNVEEMWQIILSFKKIIEHLSRSRHHTKYNRSTLDVNDIVINGSLPQSFFIDFLTKGIIA